MEEHARKRCNRFSVVVLCVGIATIVSTFWHPSTSSRLDLSGEERLSRRTQLVIDPKTVEIKPESKSYIWTPVSTENDYGRYLEQDYDTLSFDHCRPGVCRHVTKRINESSAILQLTHEEVGGVRSEVQLSKLTDVLNYFPSHIQREKESSCNIFFVGDSLSSDNAMAANCQLLNAGYTVKSIDLSNIFYMGQDGSYGGDLDKQSEQNMYPGVDHILLENTNAESCPEVLIMYAWPYAMANLLDSEGLRSVNDAGGVIVYNEGVHCNEPNTNCISDLLSKFLLPMMKGEVAERYSGWRFLFRESEPQHFNTVGGGFEKALMEDFKLGKKKLCGPTEGKDSTSWRNKEAMEFLLSQGLASRIKIVPIHSQLVPLWQIHHEKDCTHYCYNPYKFDVTWDGMLKALSSFEEFASPEVA